MRSFFLQAKARHAQMIPAWEPAFHTREDCKGFSDIYRVKSGFFRADLRNNLHDFSNLTIKAKIMQDCYKKFIESASGNLYLRSINGGETGGLFLAFLMTVLSQSFLPFVGCDFMSFSFLSARHTFVFF